MTRCNYEKQATSFPIALFSIVVFLLCNQCLAALNMVAHVGEIKADLKSVEFVNDNSNLIDYHADYKGNGILGYPFHGWRSDQTNCPVSYTKGTKISIKLRFCVTPAHMSFDIVGEDESNGPLSFEKKGITSEGNDQEIDVEASVPLPEKIDIIDQSITWYMKTAQTKVPMGISGAHIIYVTWDKPFGTTPTLKRMDWVCNLAKNARGLDEIADKIGPDAVGRNRFDSHRSIFSKPPTISTAWEVMDGTAADCGTLSTLMKYKLEMLGVIGSEVRFVYARHKKWDGLYSNSPATSELDGAGHELWMWIGGASMHGGNRYEGCCYYRSKYWEGGTGEWNSSAYQVLIDCIGDNEDGEYKSHQCWENDYLKAVSYPAETPPSY